MPAEAPVSEEERKKKSVCYEACTSPFKDDFPTLVKCMRSPEPGGPHTRQEAGFLLWHHALEGDDVAGLVNAGLLSACIANLDSSELLPADKACSAGILLALVAEDADVGEQLLRARGPSGRSAMEVLHAVLGEDEALARHHCSRVLQALAQQVAPAVLRSMEYQLPYVSTYISLWGVKEHRDAPAVAAVAELVALLLEQRAELAPLVVAAGGVGALLDVVRNHKSEVAVGAAVGCLARLLQHAPAVDEFIGSGGVPLLADVLGPPPRAALENRPETLEEDLEPESPAPETPQPRSPAAAMAAAAAALAAARGPNGGGADGGGAGGAEPAARDAADPEGDGSSGGGGGGGSTGRSSTDALNHGTAPAATSPSDADQESDSPRRSSLEHSIASPTKAGPGRGSTAAGSPIGSPISSLKQPGAAVSGNSVGWSSTRTSHRSLGSTGSASAHLRVQLPLVIPGIPQTSPAAAAAALAGSPSPLSRATSTRGRSTSTVLGSDPSVASLVDAAGAAAADAGVVAPACGTASGMTDAAAAAPLPLSLPTAADLGANRSGLRWFMLPGLEVAARAAACLTLVIQQRPECQADVELRLASHRILAQVKVVMGPKTGAGGGSDGVVPVKKGKKKGIGLSADQTLGLTRLLGLLKFLSLHNPTRYRIARLGAASTLVLLYGEASDYLLRNHCQAILANVALLAENGGPLRDAKTPEEFLVANPMRLSRHERALLRIEFPDDSALTPRR